MGLLAGLMLGSTIRVERDVHRLDDFFDPF
jgi:hypothetical protein